MIEQLGYGSLWPGEIPDLGRESFAQRPALLAATREPTTGAAIYQIAVRSPQTMDCAATPAGGFPGCFLLDAAGTG